MIVTPEKCHYKLVVLQGNGTLINITGAVEDISLEDQDGEISQHADIVVANINYGNGRLSDVIKPGCQLFYYADWGTGFNETFRGVVWDWSDKPTSSERNFEFTAYDNLIYLDKSQDNMYFAAGTKTQSIVTTIAQKWNVPLSYQYKSITHSKQILPATTLSDALKTILDDAQSKLSENYVVISRNGVLTVSCQGTNATICEFNANNCTAMQNKLSMNNLVTKVVVGGTQSSSGRIPVAAVYEGRTEYGVLQSIKNRDDSTSLADVEAAAKKLLKENGNLSEDRTIETIDVPFIRKGDKVKVNIESLQGYFHVLGVTHNPKSQTMSMQIKSASPEPVPIRSGRK